MTVRRTSFHPLCYLLLLLIIRISPTHSKNQHIQCRERERQALVEIKREFKDEYNHLSSWSSDEHNRNCCSWRGVRCSNGHVVSLDLYVTERFSSGPYQPLRGNISRSILKLKHLRYLDLSNNNFSGTPIPSFNQSLSKLRYLNLSWAFLYGTLEYQLANLSDLETLDLSVSGIRYIGDSIAWLSDLSSLKSLNMGGINLGGVKDFFRVIETLSLTELRLVGCNLSHLIPQPQPVEFKNLSSSLKVIDLTLNGLSNSIYTWLTRFQANMVHLDLSFNLLDEFIPDITGNMSSLVYLSLSSSRVKGGIPKSFGKLCKLQVLRLTNNNLDVNLPDLVHNMSGCPEKSLEVLELGWNQLHGVLPDFEAFSSLRQIDLSSNHLDGSIPDRLFQSSRLTSIELDQNQLSGPLPDVAMLSSLRKLTMRRNQLNGSLPESIGGLSQLEDLNLSENSFQGTMSEAHFRNLSKLQTLDLSGNSLSLKFGPNFTPPFHLDIIILASCNLGPRFPKWLQTQHSCSHLDISKAQINDTLPSLFWDAFSRLRHINLSSNDLHGRLPGFSSKYLRKFPTIDLSLNRFEGLLPLFPPTTVLLNLSRNKFSGNISVLCNIKYEGFSFLDLSDNLLNGTLPDCFSRFRSIRILNLASNNFSGALPEFLGSFSGLNILDLHNNSFYGDLPPTLSNCINIQFLDLSDNRFAGALPSWIGDRLLRLIFLSLKSNLIGGYISNEFCQLDNIQILDLSENKISGTIPHCLNHLTAMVRADTSSTNIGISFPFVNLNAPAMEVFGYVNEAIVRWKRREYVYSSNLGLFRIIDFSSNNLSGQIPGEITRLEALVALNLSRNELEGPIPTDIGALKEIQSLDLSRNHLSGNIPESVSNLNFLSDLDLSSNDLSGEIPSGTQLRGFNASSFEGNPGLCGPQIPNKCYKEDGSNGQEDDENKYLDDDDDDDEFMKWFYAGIGIGFGLGFWGICVVPMLKPSWRHSYSRFLDFLLLNLRIKN